MRLETIIDRAKATGLPLAKDAFRETKENPLPEPPYLVYIVPQVVGRGSDERILLHEPKEEQSEPMGILTSRAHEDMTLAILQVQAAYGLPAYLTDLIVTAVLADIRGCANKDLLNALSRKE